MILKTTVVVICTVFLHCVLTEAGVIKLSMEEMESISGNSGFVGSRLDTNGMREIKGKGCNECWKLGAMCGLRNCSSSPCSYCTDSGQANRICHAPAPNKNCTPDTETGGCGVKWINGTCDANYCSGGEESGNCDRNTATGNSCS